MIEIKTSDAHRDAMLERVVNGECPWTIDGKWPTPYQRMLELSGQQEAPENKG